MEEDISEDVLSEIDMRGLLLQTDIDVSLLLYRGNEENPIVAHEGRRLTVCHGEKFCVHLVLSRAKHLTGRKKKLISKEKWKKLVIEHVELDCRVMPESEFKDSFSHRTDSGPAGLDNSGYFVVHEVKKDVEQEETILYDITGHCEVPPKLRMQSLYIYMLLTAQRTLRDSHFLSSAEELELSSCSEILDDIVKEMDDMMMSEDGDSAFTKTIREGPLYASFPYSVETEVMTLRSVPHMKVKLECNVADSCVLISHVVLFQRDTSISSEIPFLIHPVTLPIHLSSGEVFVLLFALPSHEEATCAVEDNESYILRVHWRPDYTPEKHEVCTDHPVSCTPHEESQIQLTLVSPAFVKLGERFDVDVLVCNAGSSVADISLHIASYNTMNPYSPSVGMEHTHLRKVSSFCRTYTESQESGLLCEDKVVIVGRIGASSSRRVMLQFVGVRPGVFAIERIRLLDRLTDKVHVMQGRCEVIVKQDR